MTTEEDPPGKGWEPYGSGYEIDPTGGSDGKRALRLINDVSSDVHGAWQVITLNQTEPRPIFIGGWSKAEHITDIPDSNYSLYLDVYDTNGSWLYQQVLQFDTGTHDWQFRGGSIIPDTPIGKIHVHCLLRWTHSGTAWFDNLIVRELGKEIEAVLSSGSFDECGRYRCESTVQPWCSGPAGCYVFTVNPDPDVNDPDYPLNKAHLGWNQTAREAYTNTPGLDGDYVDSYSGHATAMDFRIAHFAAADIPLTFRTSDHRVGIPEVFATTELARWLAQDAHENLGKWTMANWILRELPWGADLFDVMGTETTALPEDDAVLSYYRTLSFQRPYGLLLNTNFDDLTHELVKRYFRVSLFYGIYPSMFSHNAAEEPYWEDPTLYNRDRDLFKRYIPLIRRLNMAGWQPVTYATTSDPEVYIERFGAWPYLHFTLRNLTTETKSMTVTLLTEPLKLPTKQLTATALLDGTEHPVNTTGTTHTLSMTLAPQASEILAYNYGPDVALGPVHVGSAGRGCAITYTLTLTNNGNYTDTFNLSVGGAEWESYLSSARSGLLPPGRSFSFTLTVTVPFAISDTQDVATVTVASRLGQDVSDFIQVTTTAGEASCRACLPFIIKER